MCCARLRVRVKNRERVARARGEQPRVVLGVAGLCALEVGDPAIVPSVQESMRGEQMVQRRSRELRALEMQEPDRAPKLDSIAQPALGRRQARGSHRATDPDIERAILGKMHVPTKERWPG